MTYISNNTFRRVAAIKITGTFLLSFFLMLSSCSRSESPQPVKQTKMPIKSGPLMDQGNVNISPSDELAVDENDPKALAMFGDRYFESGRYAEAIDVYKKVLALDPDDIDTYNDLGLAYQYLNQPEKAIETLKKGSEIMPSYQRIWISLGFVAASAGRTEDAQTALAKAVELGPDTPVGKEASRMLSQIK